MGAKFPYMASFWIEVYSFFFEIYTHIIITSDVSLELLRVIKTTQERRSI